MRFSRDSRLSRKPEFDRVFRDAELRFRRGPFRALACANGECRPRLGLIVGKRNARRAVDRNRIKREIRESFRQHADSLPPCDVVVQLIERLERPRCRDLATPLGAIWTEVRSQTAGGGA